jgi:hypothetical protein
VIKTQKLHPGSELFTKLHVHSYETILQSEGIKRITNTRDLKEIGSR